VRRAGWALLFGIFLAATALPARAAKDDLLLVSRDNGAAGTVGSNDSTQAAVSADGQFVAFASEATNLAGGIDGDFSTDVFRRDLVNNVTVLVSRATGVSGAAGTGNSSRPAISADGRYVAFYSEADNLSTEDDDERIDVFVRDLVDGTTELVSRATGPTGAGGDGDSFDPSISADGLLVAFSSEASNLSDDDAFGSDVFVRDLTADTTTFVSRETGPTGAGGDDTSASPSISADGSLVAFSSYAENLSDEDVDELGNDDLDVFVRDLTAHTTEIVSRATGGAGAVGDGNSHSPAISADGSRVAFASIAENLSAVDATAVQDVFVRDLDADTTTFVSRATGPAGKGGKDISAAPSISGDGRFVAFQSEADNLSSADDNARLNVFRRDLDLDVTVLVSRRATATGGKSNGDSRRTSISGEGRYVAFESEALNLNVDDVNDDPDIYLRDVSGPLAFSVNNVTAKEGKTGTTIFTFTVSLSARPTTTVSVDANTVDGSAKAGSDYTAIAPTTLTFDPGESTQPFAVTVFGDKKVENTEKFTVALSAAEGAAIDDGQGVGKIKNDDT
jgi:Tol biopolymer transport system component